MPELASSLPELAAVSSSNLAAVGYDAVAQALYIRFRSGTEGATGKVWRYHDVPPHVHEELMRSGSLGSYFYRYIRNKFRAEAVDGPVAPAAAVDGDGIPLQDYDARHPLAGVIPETHTGDAAGISRETQTNAEPEAHPLKGVIPDEG